MAPRMLDAQKEVNQSSPLLRTDQPKKSGQRLINPYTDDRGQILPQAIAHRGFKNKYPENTLVAFQAAITCGVHALETDLHLTKDGVVVLSHDKSLKRCFGVDKNVNELEWAEIKTLETVKEPKQHMPQLLDFLELLALPENQHIWVILDIKLDDPSDDLMRCLAETLAKAPVSEPPWDKRLMLGIWVTSYLEPCSKYLPSYPIIHIGFSVLYAKKFLRVPNASFNLFQKALMGPIGHQMIKRCRNEGRSVVAWTVNEPRLMKWCIRKGIDGVITDDPELYLKVCKEYKPEKKSFLSISRFIDALYADLFIGILSLVFIFLYPLRSGKAVVNKKLEVAK